MGENLDLFENSYNKDFCNLIDSGHIKQNVGSKKSDFNIEKTLSKNKFSSTYLIFSKITNSLYVMKELKLINDNYKSEEEFKKLKNEMKILENLENPHIIKYFNSFFENDNFYIIMEYINGESLLERYIEKKELLNEKILWTLLIQSVNGLLYMNNNKIIHRNIKLENLLIDGEGNLKFSDFDIVGIINKDYASNNVVKEISLTKNGNCNSDLYMLGLSFIYLMMNKMPEKEIDFKYYKIPNNKQKLNEIYSYSKELKNIILKLLDDSEKKSSIFRIYSEIISFYNYKYLKFTSICSTLLCLLSIPSFVSYFKEKIFENNKKIDTKKYIIASSLKDAMEYLNPFNYKNAKIECLRLRTIMYFAKEKMFFIPEINLIEFVSDLLSKIHSESNKYIGNSNNLGKNNINLEEEINKEEENFDNSNEQQVARHTIRTLTIKYKSIISELFYYLEKTVNECSQCKNKIKYLCTINNICTLYPEKASVYLNKKEMNIIDLFKHYRKRRNFIDENIHCQTCGKIQNEVIKTKIFYTSPNILILNISYLNEKEFKLKIDEYINIEEFVERKNISKMDYILVGAIFIEKNIIKEDQYISITRKDNGEWIYFNGNSIQVCTFNEIYNHNQLKMLFYLGKEKHF